MKEGAEERRRKDRFVNAYWGSRSSKTKGKRIPLTPVALILRT